MHESVPIRTIRTGILRGGPSLRAGRRTSRRSAETSPRVPPRTGLRTTRSGRRTARPSASTWDRGPGPPRPTAFGRSPTRSRCRRRGRSPTSIRDGVAAEWCACSWPAVRSSDEIAYANYNEIAVTTTSSLTGTTILQYRIGRRLGAGGMGEVYIADDTRLGRQVALKFLRADRQRDGESRARLIREARAASLLQSPNIAVTYDLLEHDGQMFIAMEYVEGELVAERIARGPLPPMDAVDIAAQVASALEEAHGRNIIHRDIKSANLVQTPRGLVKVLDFGLAKMEVTG